MAVTFSNTEANSLLTSLTTSGAYVSLHSGNPGTTGASELSGNGYARKAANWGSASAQKIGNSSAVTFGPATPSSWSAATYFGLWDASTSGNFIAGGALANSVTVPAAGTASFAINDLMLGLVAVP